MGVNWAATLLGIIGIILTPSPFLFYKFGARIRAGSTFAPGIVSVSVIPVVVETLTDNRHGIEGSSHSQRARTGAKSWQCIRDTVHIPNDLGSIWHCNSSYLYYFSMDSHLHILLHITSDATLDILNSMTGQDYAEP